MNDENDSLTWLEKIAKIFAKEPETREDLESLLEEAKIQDLIETDTLLMLKGVLEVAESKVRDVMIPRVQVAYIDEKKPLDKILEFMLETSHSRYPVFSASDEIVGVLLAKDVLKAVAKQQLNNHDDLKKLYRNPEMVSESKRLNVLLRDFKKIRSHIALVVDEYGEFAGIVTIEDVLEQIVGEIEDEHDEIENNIQKHVSGDFLVDATTSMMEFNKFFASNLQDEKIETIGGLVLKELGRIPRQDERFSLAGLNVQVYKADARKVEGFLVTCNDKCKNNIENEKNT